MRNNRPVHLPKRLNDDAYGIMALYESEYGGIVQYYRLAYNLHTLDRVKWVAEQSRTKHWRTSFARVGVRSIDGSRES